MMEPKNSIFDLVLELHMLNTGSSESGDYNVIKKALQDRLDSWQVINHKWSTFDNKVKELVETVLSEKHWINPVLEKNKMFTYPVEKNELHISNENSIYHLEYGQLCYIEKHYDCYLYYPIKFTKRETAKKWIEQGTIAELQESMSILGIGFTTKNFEKRD